jgi:hypothetical protein
VLNQVLTTDKLQWAYLLGIALGENSNELPWLMLVSVKFDCKWKSIGQFKMRSLIQCFNFSNFYGALGSKYYNITEYSNLLHGFVQQLAAEGHCLLGIPHSLIENTVEAAHFSDTLVSVYQTAWYHNSEGNNLHSHWCENLKTHSW